MNAVSRNKLADCDGVSFNIASVTSCYLSEGFQVQGYRNSYHGSTVTYGPRLFPTRESALNDLNRQRVQGTSLDAKGIPTIVLTTADAACLLWEPTPLFWTDYRVENEIRVFAPYTPFKALFDWLTSVAERDLKRRLVAGIFSRDILYLFHRALKHLIHIDNAPPPQSRFKEWELVDISKIGTNAREVWPPRLDTSYANEVIRQILLTHSNEAPC